MYRFNLCYTKTFTRGENQRIKFRPRALNEQMGSVVAVIGDRPIAREDLDI
jgi:hypothetical protein